MSLLLPNVPEDCQVFETFTSRSFHEKFYKTFDNLELFDATVVAANAFTNASSTYVESLSRVNLLKRARSRFIIQRNNNNVDNNATNCKGIESACDELSHFLQSSLKDS